MNEPDLIFYDEAAFSARDIQLYKAELERVSRLELESYCLRDAPPAELVNCPVYEAINAWRDKHRAPKAKRERRTAQWKQERKGRTGK